MECASSPRFLFMNDITARVIVKRSRPQVPFNEEPPAKPERNRRLTLADARAELTTVAEKLAGDQFCYNRWYYPHGAKLFPLDIRAQYVSKYYPHAKNGPLLVDEPRTSTEEKFCHEKGKFLKGLGYRYIVVRNGTTEFDALEQLGEL